MHACVPACVPIGLPYAQTVLYLFGVRPFNFDDVVRDGVHVDLENVVLFNSVAAAVRRSGPPCVMRVLQRQNAAGCCSDEDAVWAQE